MIFRISKTMLLIALSVLAVRVIAAALVPILQDEAYYFVWANHLDWGYFDHPPGVAFVSLTSLLGDSPIFGRLGALIAGVASIPLLVYLYKEAGLNKTGRLPVAVILATMSVGGIAGGVLVAPDALMIFAWVGALWSAARALNIDPRWWLVAGVFTGVGLLSKYVMLIIGPIFLWGLIRGAPQQLKSPWPYLGGVLALLIFLPHLTWNAQNDWVTFRFQLKHGLSNAHDIEQDSSTDRALPVAQKAREGSPEFLLAQQFVDPDFVEKERRVRGTWEKRWRRYKEFIGSQFALWGLLLLGLIPSWVRAARLRFWKNLPVLPSRPLIYASAVFPLVVFAAVAWGSKVEANWPAVYMIGAAAIFTPPLDKFRHYVYAGAALNGILIVLYAIHSATPFLPIKPRKDRVLRDSAGYEQVAQYTADTAEFVFFDTYQTGAMLAHYQPELATRQWPGITRTSEFERREDLQKLGLDDTEGEDGFWLLIANRVPPILDQFRPNEEQMLVYCTDKGLIALRSPAGQFEHPCPETKVRTWYMVHYQLAEETAGESQSY